MTTQLNYSSQMMYNSNKVLKEVSANGNTTITSTTPSRKIMERIDDDVVEVEQQINLHVTLPDGQQTKMVVDSGTPMMDLLVTLAGRCKLNPSALTMMLISKDTGKPIKYKPNQTIGSLEGRAVHVISKEAGSGKSSKKSSRKETPFEVTHRFTVNLPKGRKTVVRISPALTLADLVTAVCKEKGLDPDLNKYVLEIPNHPGVYVDLNATVENVGVQEVNLVTRSLQDRNYTVSMPDLSKSPPTGDQTPFTPRTAPPKKKRGFFSFLIKKDKKYKDVRRSLDTSSLKLNTSTAEGFTPSNSQLTTPSNSQPATPSSLQKQNSDPHHMKARPRSMIVTTATVEGQFHDHNLQPVMTLGRKTRPAPEPPVSPNYGKQQAQMTVVNGEIKTNEIDVNNALEKPVIEEITSEEKMTAGQPMKYVPVSVSSEHVAAEDKIIHSRNSSDVDGYPGIIAQEPQVNTFFTGNVSKTRYNETVEESPVGISGESRAPESSNKMLSFVDGQEKLEVRHDQKILTTTEYQEILDVKGDQERLEMRDGQERLEIRGDKERLEVSNDSERLDVGKQLHLLGAVTPDFTTGSSDISSSPKKIKAPRAPSPSTCLPTTTTAEVEVVKRKLDVSNNELLKRQPQPDFVDSSLVPDTNFSDYPTEKRERNAVNFNNILDGVVFDEDPRTMEMSYSNKWRSSAREEDHEMMMETASVTSENIEQMDILSHSERPCPFIPPPPPAEPPDLDEHMVLTTASTTQPMFVDKGTEVNDDNISLAASSAKSSPERAYFGGLTERAQIVHNFADGSPTEYESKQLDHNFNITPIPGSANKEAITTQQGQPLFKDYRDSELEIGLQSQQKSKEISPSAQDNVDSAWLHNQTTNSMSMSREYDEPVITYHLSQSDLNAKTGVAHEDKIKPEFNTKIGEAQNVNIELSDSELKTKIRVAEEDNIELSKPELNTKIGLAEDGIQLSQPERNAKIAVAYEDKIQLSKPEIKTNIGVVQEDIQLSKPEVKSKIGMVQEDKTYNDDKPSHTGDDDEYFTEIIEELIIPIGPNGYDFAAARKVSEVDRSTGKVKPTKQETAEKYGNNMNSSLFSNMSSNYKPQLMLSEQEILSLSTKKEEFVFTTEDLSRINFLSPKPKMARPDLEFQPHVHDSVKSLEITPVTSSKDIYGGEAASVTSSEAIISMTHEKSEPKISQNEDESIIGAEHSSMSVEKRKLLPRLPTMRPSFLVDSTQALPSDGDQSDRNQNLSEKQKTHNINPATSELHDPISSTSYSFVSATSGLHDPITSHNFRSYDPISITSSRAQDSFSMLKSKPDNSNITTISENEDSISASTSRPQESISKTTIRQYDSVSTTNDPISVTTDTDQINSQWTSPGQDEFVGYHWKDDTNRSLFKSRKDSTTSADKMEQSYAKKSAFRTIPYGSIDLVESENQTEALQSQYQSLQSRLSQWQEQLALNQSVLTSQAAGADIQTGQQQEVVLSGKKQPISGSKHEGRSSSVDLPSRKDKPAVVTSSHTVSTNLLPSQSSSQLRSKYVNAENTVSVVTPSTTQHRSTIVKVESSTKRNKFEPELDPREKLMIAIRNFSKGGLKSVPIEKTRWTGSGTVTEFTPS